MNGGERTKVCEHLSVVYFDVEAYPEPKSLKKSDLKCLLDGLGTVAAVEGIEQPVGTAKRRNRREGHARLHARAQPKWIWPFMKNRFPGLVTGGKGSAVVDARK